MEIITVLSKFTFLPLLRDIAVGIACLIGLLVFHGSAINHVYMRFERITRKNLNLDQHNRVFFHFYTSFVFLALFHILEIIFWAMIIIGLGIMITPLDALLFAGSCYTTVGFEPDTLKVGWKGFAFFISLSGLFSLAWTTSIMIPMTATYKKAWDQKYHNTDVI
jgi:hypothetical protein